MPDRGSVFVVDDDSDLAASIARLLRRHGLRAEPVSDPSLLLETFEQGPPACFVSDMMMGEAQGFSFAHAIRLKDPAAAFVFMTAWPSTTDAVDAIRRHKGIDYLEKPLDEARLVAAVQEALAWSRRCRNALGRVASLTRREREVFNHLVRGLSNKAVAQTLGLSPKTIEDHRSAVMTKTGAETLADLIAIHSALAEC